MWVRIAARYPVWYEPSVLAGYRSHTKSKTPGVISGWPGAWVHTRRAIEMFALSCRPSRAGHRHVGLG